jgi:NADPH:quinone reductase
MLRKGHIKPVIFDTKYKGLESIPDALQDLAERKVWGKSIVFVQPENRKAKL